MNLELIMKELEGLGTERTKKIYLANGAKEPLFGVATGAMKPLKKLVKKNQSLANELYATGNYDAMYFAGVIADVKQMDRNLFNQWMDEAYFYMLSDYVVAVSLAESTLGQIMADEWIASDEELRQSAGWSCYCWMLGNQRDAQFDKDKILHMLLQVKESIYSAPKRAKISMNLFLSTVAISYMPLHEEALTIAKDIGPITIQHENKKPTTLYAYETINKDIERNRIGFKRKYVRC